MTSNNPGFTDKGLAQHFARVLVVEVCEADQRFWKAKLGTLNRSSSKVLKHLKHFAKETSLRTPVTQLYVMKLRSTQDCPIWGRMKDVMLHSREYVIPERSLQRMSSNVFESILFDKKGARCHLFKHGYEIPEQKSKAAARLRMWPFVQHSANNPGFPNKGLAQSTSPIVFSLCRDSQIFTENLSWIVSAGYIGVSAQKPETLMPWRIYQLWDSVVETFLQATKWNVWPTFTSVSLSLTTKLENFEIKNAKGSSPSANG